MTNEDLKTYRDWLAEGRHVRPGEKANFYLVNDDASEGVAVFSLEQTDEISRVHKDEGWTRIVPADDKPKKKSRKQAGSTKPKIKVEYTSDTGLVRIWVGPNKRAIAQLKKSGYRFDPITHRWTATRDDLIAVVAGLEKHHPDADVEAPKEAYPEI